MTVSLNKPVAGSQNWDVPVNANWDTIEAALNALETLSASKVLVSNSNGKVATSSITSTKLGYLTDVTSNIQAQINAKVGAPNYGGSSDVKASCYVASGTGYKPTKNGVLYFTSYQLGTTSTLYVYNGSTLVFQKTLAGSPSAAVGYTMSSFIPVNKNYSYRIYGGSTNQSVIFIPCE